MILTVSFLMLASQLQQQEPLWSYAVIRKSETSSESSVEFIEEADLSEGSQTIWFEKIGISCNIGAANTRQGGASRFLRCTDGKAEAVTLAYCQREHPQHFSTLFFDGPTNGELWIVGVRCSL